VVLLLGAGFGLVGLDRWIIAPLFPAMMKDLNLNYQDLGNLVGILAVAWGLFSILMGRASDRLGRRRILIPALLIFSALSLFTGLSGGIVGLLSIRALMGASEGAYLAASVAAAGEASHPKRRGFNQGLQMSGFALFGFGLGPIIATQLMAYVASWRYVFMIVALPGFILAGFVWRDIREPEHLASGTKRAAPNPWAHVFRSRNIIVAMLAIMCTMSCVFVLGAMIPSYLVDYLHITSKSMGFVMSALGFGGFLGAVLVPGVSDHIGRKAASLVAFALAAAGVYLLTGIGPEPTTLFALLFVIAFFCMGLLTLLTGPVATEAVSLGSISSAAGLVSGVGEIFGGGVAPAIAGFVAQHFGIEHVLTVALTGLCCGAVASLFLRETAPRRTGTGVDFAV
jgi:predicted MFS family arabinose efflux permease